MLKRLFTSNTRIKLLKTFLMNPKEEFFIRELTRKLNEQINSVRRELDNLKKMGLLKAKIRNRKKFYCINDKFYVLNELTGLVLKEPSTDKRVAKDLEKFGELKLLVLSGFFVNKESTPVDMLIVGEIDREKLTDYLNNEIASNRPVRFTVLSEEDYKYRINCNDRFLTEIINNESNLVPINKLEG